MEEISAIDVAPHNDHMVNKDYKVNRLKQFVEETGQFHGSQSSMLDVNPTMVGKGKNKNTAAHTPDLSAMLATNKSSRVQSPTLPGSLM